MITILRSQAFDTWLSDLRDSKARARIAARIRAATLGNFGDSRSVGNGVSEMRIHFGPGYRVYYLRRGAAVYLLLLGGDKSSQQRDIRQAIQMAHELGED